MRTSTCLDEYSADCEYYGGGVVCMVVTFIFLFSFPFRLEPARVAWVWPRELTLKETNELIAELAFNRIEPTDQWFFNICHLLILPLFIFAACINDEFSCLLHNIEGIVFLDLDFRNWNRRFEARLHDEVWDWRGKLPWWCCTNRQGRSAGGKYHVPVTF